MQVFIPGRPSDLLERIVTLVAIDPANPLLAKLVEREQDLFTSSTLGGITSAGFKSFLDELSNLKTQLAAAFASVRQAKHDMLNKAMESKATVEDFKTLVMTMKLADQQLSAVKVRIDTLITNNRPST